MSADVQSSPKVVTDHQPVQSQPNASQGPHMSRRTSGRLQQQRRSNGGINASLIAYGGGKDKKNIGGSGGGNNNGGKDKKPNASLICSGGKDKKIGVSSGTSGRKRSQSFSGGGGGGNSVVGGGGFGGKMFPSYKRRKKDHIIPPTKFLLGGNICDPLNLNSLLDEDINRAMNAVTPKSSPLPTPKHRKGKVEVIIPPNINDPLNLLQMSADGDDADDTDYQQSLISPVKGGGGGAWGGGVGGGKRNKRKRRHTKSFSQKDDSGGDDIGLSLVAATGDEARLHEADTASAESEGNFSGAGAAMEMASLTRQQAARANLKLDLSLGCSGSDDKIKKDVDDCDVTSPVKAKRISGGEVCTTDYTPTNSHQAAQDNSTVPLATPVAAELVTSSSTPTTTTTAAVMSSNKPITRPMTSSTKPVMPSSLLPSSGGAIKKCRKESKDKIVSPAIPQPGAWGDKSHHHHHHHHRFRPPHVGAHTPQIDKNQKTPNFKEVNTRFRYGNYNRYYGYRNPGSGSSSQQQHRDPVDPRLRVLLRRRDLFESRDVLDVGCNVGHVTLAVARDTHPRSIVGVDIDRTLVEAAKRNVKHYLKGGGNCGTGTVEKLPYPAAMPVMYGPLDAPAVGGERRFPYNVSFVQGNYVLDSDALLSLDERCQFDTILCLSVTKWLHLNWGDAGLKRAFRRMYAQLRPGGRLILEPQPWHSYKKKRNLTPEIWNNYKSIELFPHKFSQFLLSEVGFTKCEVVGTPHHHAKGFQRPIKLFTKGEASSAPCSVRTSEEVPVVTSSGLQEERGSEQIGRGSGGSEQEEGVSVEGGMDVVEENADTVFNEHVVEKVIGGGSDQDEWGSGGSKQMERGSVVMSSVLQEEWRSDQEERGNTAAECGNAEVSERVERGNEQ